MQTATIGQDMDRAEWLGKRTTGIGASETPVVLGLTGSRLKLYLRKRGELAPDEQNEAMQNGLDLEPIIAAAYERRTGRRIARFQRFLRHPEMPWVLATLDAITECGRTVEFKSCSVFSPFGRQIGDDGDSETLPDAWVVQVQQQLLLGQATGETDGEDADVAVWRDNRLHGIYPMRRNDNFISAIVDAVHDFWHGHVLTGIPPEDLVAEDAAVLARLYRGQSGETLSLGSDVEEHAIAYSVLGESISDLQRQREIHKATLLAAIGNADAATFPGGWGLRRKMIETREHIVKGSSYPRLTVKGPQ